MSHGHRHLSRRDFLKLAAAGAGGAVLASCNRGVQLTAIPATPMSIPTLPTGCQADIILVNGKVVVMDTARTIAQAVAVTGTQVMATGTDETIRALANEQTQTIDLNGRTVTPGLIDAHCHLSACGLLGTAYVDLSWPAVFTISDMQDKLAEKIATTPAGEWVVGSGWVTFEGRYPDKNDLDPVSPNHPVFALNMGGHMAAVNSLALEMAGVTASTRDPGTGRFMRDENGEPNGAVLNHPAMDYFRKLWPPEFLDVDIYETSILNPQLKFASLGVTSFQDVYARDLERMQAYFNLGSRGEMSIRGQVMNVLEYIEELDGRIEAIEAMRYEDDYMHFGGAKFQVDGALEASYTHEPHNGIAYDVTIWKARDLKEAVRAFHDAGYQVALHTGGDAAVDMALDAIEYAMNRNPRPDPRHRIEHSVLNTDDALQRQKDLGVIISTQPTLIRAFGDAVERIWGAERLQRIIPTRTWLDMGIPLALSSDAPSMPWWDPQSTLAASILRYCMSGKEVSMDQALTIDEAMYAHTMGGAYADFIEHKKGSLEAGKLADLIIWNDDPYTVEPIDILDLLIDLTMVGGKIVYERSG